MSDARMAFKQLRAEVGAEYNAGAMHTDLEAVERRVERARVTRALVATGALLAVIGVIAVAVPRLAGMTEQPPVSSPTPSVTPTSGAAYEADLPLMPCRIATVVPGNAVEYEGGEILAGFEGWFNGQLTGPGCESRESWTSDLYLAEAHPATVWINTIDYTVIEAYYRTSKDDLGDWAHMDGKTITDPDPAWPADSFVLIDAQTGEVLSVGDPADYESGSVQGTVAP